MSVTERFKDFYTELYPSCMARDLGSEQILNKLHNIHHSTSHWAALPVRRHDVRLTQLRIGHTRFTHRHLLLGENAPELCFLKRLIFGLSHFNRLSRF
ncbi:hypothetical protein TNCV_2315941 [Trichonephila clavipes]|nr:hypothetical protein TNCV_2315941 [Trichonephila clavipes]